jgi:hypothetical protein
MPDDPMWLWWTLTLVLCAWKLVEGFVRPQRMLEWPFLAASMWIYFYVYMAYSAKLKLQIYLPNDITNIGQLMPLLCFVGVLAGWALGTRRNLQRRPMPSPPRPILVWWAGFLCMLVGAVGAFSVMNAVDTSGVGVYQVTSAYWYLLFYVGYPGLAMAVWALFKVDPAYRKILWIVALLAMAAFMFPNVYNARRGPLFPSIMVLLLVPPLTLRRPPNPIVFFGGLFAVGFVMLLFLQVRSVTYRGGTWSEAFSRLSVDDAITERADDAQDNEYVNNCQQIATIYQNGKYQYGTGHLSLLLHWVPRSFWRDKPILGEGNYSFNEMFDDVEQAFGERLLGAGAASGGVADSFIQYGILCPVYWLGLSWLYGRVYVRAREGRPRWIFCYVGLMCASHWLISQSFAAAAVPGLYFQVVPFGVFFVFNLIPSARMPMRPVRQRVAPSLPQPQPVES